MQSPCNVETGSVGHAQLPAAAMQADSSHEHGRAAAGAGSGAGAKAGSQVCVPAPLPYAFGAGGNGLLPLLLQVGNDQHLSHSRQLLVERAGFSVHSCAGAHVAYIADFLAPILAVVVLCQTLEPYEALQQAQLLRRYNHNLVFVRLSEAPRREYKNYDEVLRTPVHPAALMREMRHLQRRAATRSLRAESTSLVGDLPHA